MSYAELAWMTTAKLFIHPAITWGTFVVLGVDDKVWMITTVVLAALPTGALVHVVAFKYGFFEKETLQIIVLSLLSVSFVAVFTPVIKPWILSTFLIGGNGSGR
jgi:malonate transporter